LIFGRIVGLVTIRELTTEERTVLDLLMSRPFPGQAELLQQLPSAKTSGSSCPCGCPTIGLVVDNQAPAANVSNRFPTEAIGRDARGNLVGILLFVDDGYMSELDFYSVEGDDISFPRVDSLILVELSEPDQTGGRTMVNELPA
jgi:hypothetical protein